MNKKLLNYKTKSIKPDLVFTIDNLVYSDLFELEKVDGMHFDSISEAFKILKKMHVPYHTV